MSRVQTEEPVRIRIIRQRIASSVSLKGVTDTTGPNTSCCTISSSWRAPAITWLIEKPRRRVFAAW